MVKTSHISSIIVSSFLCMLVLFCYYTSYNSNYDPIFSPKIAAILRVINPAGGPMERIISSGGFSVTEMGSIAFVIWSVSVVAFLHLPFLVWHRVKQGNSALFASLFLYSIASALLGGYIGYQFWVY